MYTLYDKEIQNNSTKWAMKLNTFTNELPSLSNNHITYIMNNHNIALEWIRWSQVYELHPIIILAGG